ncbi:hypothetical protein Tsubulata_037286 [Turnera subulata]|uniref:Uncharacterized protein n=1 Tax=Turnera subulata TaxID=218843 RepID=A0A9Q0F9J5_9ROSI|nr:hypothetical protein Tsubulata_037286 [Turnera subulata]
MAKPFFGNTLNVLRSLEEYCIANMSPTKIGMVIGFMISFPTIASGSKYFVERVKEESLKLVMTRALEQAVEEKRQRLQMDSSPTE